MPPRKWPLSQHVKRGKGQGSQGLWAGSSGPARSADPALDNSIYFLSCGLESQAKVSAGWFLLSPLPWLWVAGISLHLHVPFPLCLCPNLLF